MLNAEEKLADYYEKLMHIAKNSSKTDEDSILLAGAMMAASRVLFYEHLNAKDALKLFTKDLNNIRQYYILSGGLSQIINKLIDYIKKNGGIIKNNPSKIFMFEADEVKQIR